MHVLRPAEVVFEVDTVNSHMQVSCMVGISIRSLGCELPWLQLRDLSKGPGDLMKAFVHHAAPCI